MYVSVSVRHSNLLIYLHNVNNSTRLTNLTAKLFGTI